MEWSGPTGLLAVAGVVGGFFLVQFLWHLLFKGIESPSGQTVIRGVLKVGLGLCLLLIVGMCVSLNSRGDDPHGLGDGQDVQFNRW